MTNFKGKFYNHHPGQELEFWGLPFLYVPYSKLPPLSPRSNCYPDFYSIHLRYRFLILILRQADIALHQHLPWCFYQTQTNNLDGLGTYVTNFRCYMSLYVN